MALRKGPAHEHKHARPDLVGSRAFFVREALPADRHPVQVYLAKLSPPSRRPMRTAFDVMARFVSAGRAGAHERSWMGLRYQQAAAVRAMLAPRYAPATANRMLAALRGVSSSAGRPGTWTRKTYHRVIDLLPVRGERLLHGRALAIGEIRSLFARVPLTLCAMDRYR